jgi:hypothetical protein
LSTIIYLTKSKSHSAGKCDILIFLNYKNGAEKYGMLRTALARKGVATECVSDEYFNQAKSCRALLSWSKADLSIKVPVLNFFVERHKPTVVVVEDDTLSETDYHFLKNKQITVVNQAHGATGGGELFNSMHFDYYYIFGKRSYSNLIKNPHAKGGALIKLTGSPFFQRCSIKISEMSNRCQILLVGAYFHQSFDVSDYLKFREYYMALYKIASELKDVSFIYKPHYRRHPELESDLLGLSNVIEEGGVIHDLTNKCNLAIMAPSVSSIEAAATATPFIIFDWNPNSKWSRETINDLGDTDYFGRVFDFGALLKEYRRRVVPSDLDLKSLECYYKMHIERDDSVEFISQLMFDIVKGRKNSKCAV